MEFLVVSMKMTNCFFLAFPSIATARYVKVYLDGDRLVVEEGQAAYLICSIAGFPETDIKKYDVRWVFNNHKTVGSGRQYSIYRAERKDEGTYTCEVTDYYTTSSASFYLPIKGQYECLITFYLFTKKKQQQTNKTCA